MRKQCRQARRNWITLSSTKKLGSLKNVMNDQNSSATLPIIDTMKNTINIMMITTAALLLTFEFFSLLASITSLYSFLSVSAVLFNYAWRNF